MTIGMLADLSVATRNSRSWLLATWRLARWDLFLAWRRVMSKVLLGLLLGGYALIVLFIMLAYALTVANNEDATSVRDVVTFPLSVGIPDGLLRYLGVLLTCILAGAVVGGEYGYGTHRLSLSRGVSRAQSLAAQALALALIAPIITGGALLIAALLGMTLGPALGSDLLIPLPNGWLQILLYGLALAVNLWGYMLIALFFATLGRSAAAGIGGAVGLLFIEFVLNLALGGIAGVLAFSDQQVAALVVQTIQQLFPGNALGSLVDYAGLGPIPLTSNPFDPLWLALVVSVVYCAGLIGGSYLLFRFRDVTD
jgi:ABC-type transport system involved in multi-copper enzyme maturation permease subunit